jgi:hypothetical protein
MSMMHKLNLTPEQKAESARIKAQLLPALEQEADFMADLLASKSTANFFGETEFELRDSCHRIGVGVLQAALDERKKGGT